jgi:hypothetical protein
MSRHIKIAFIGGFHAGKTTTSKMLAEQYVAQGFLHTHLSFAGPLRAEIAAAVATEEISAAQILSELTDEHLKVRWRAVMQFWGTELRRTHFGEDYWVNKLKEEMEKFKQGNDAHDLLFTVDDCRFTNERATLVNEGFKFIRLSNYGDLDRATRHDTHASEKEWRMWKPDYISPWFDDQAERVERIVTWLEAKFPEVKDEVPDEA